MKNTRCSENVRQIYRRAPMSKCDFNKIAIPKCDFNKVARQLY